VLLFALTICSASAIAKAISDLRDEFVSVVARSLEKLSSWEFSLDWMRAALAFAKVIWLSTASATQAAKIAKIMKKILMEFQAGVPSPDCNYRRCTLMLAR
jgi:hypothetical protein